jgi:hypothetical protein
MVWQCRPQKPAKWQGAPRLIGMRPVIGSARLLRRSKDRLTSPEYSCCWCGSMMGGSRFRLMQTKTDRLGSSPCRSMKGGWQGPLLFCPPQICSRPSTKSASKLGVAQTRPNRAKSRNAGVVSRVTTTAAAAALPAGRTFGIVIFCTADPGIADGKTRSKWSRVLRYARKTKPADQRLTEFIKLIGGLNQCARRFARKSGSMAT